MTTLSEDRVYARHARIRGAVLVVGVGAVGGFVAEELAAMGVSPLWLLDKDLLEDENLVRNPLGAESLGRPKAVDLADRIRRDLPLCEAHGILADFTELPDDEQFRLVRQADVVVAATDEADCQRRVNAVSLATEVTAVYPAVWVDRRVRDAEVGEILWVLPGRHTPCYECWTTFRQGAADAQAGRGARSDIQQVSLTTALVVSALLNRRDPRSTVLDPHATAIYVHGLSPTSPGVRGAFPTSGLYSRNVHVPFPATQCPACGAHEPAATASPAAQPELPALAPAQPELPLAAAIPERDVANRLGAFFSSPRVPIALLGGLGIVLLFSFLKVLIAPEPATNLSQEAAPNVESQVESAPESQVESAPLDDSELTDQSPQGDEEQVAPESQTGQRVTVDFTIDNMADLCQLQYGDPSATAVVIETPPDPPGWWISCLNTGGENIGGVDLDKFCSEQYAGTVSANPDIWAAEAWTRWYCAVA